ncbi:MAG: peptidyl-prolyl cis-trans isomerase [Acidobacteria bacterium]|nr:peptidyl-prolyl cis-trans isomerase [Acidobacteriota bacterium]
MTMLDRMRRHKGWLKWSLGLVVFAFIAFYIPSFLSDPTVSVGVLPGEVIAEVEGRKVTVGQFLQQYNAQVQAYRTAYGGSMTDELLRQLGIDQQILQQMVDEQATLTEAERQGIAVSDEELAQQIFAIPGLQEDGRFVGEDRYELILRSQVPPLTKAAFEESLRRSLMAAKLRAALTDWMTVSDAEVERGFTEQNEKVRLQVVALTADRFRDQVTVTDADVAAYFDEHQEDYRVDEQRTVKLLLLDRDQAQSAVTVLPADLQRYYNNNIGQYQTPEQIRASHILLNTEGKDEAEVRAQAEDLLMQLEAGADFAMLATTYSEDSGTAVNGGDLDYFGRGRMVPEFETAAFALEPGQTSGIVQTQYGFHIIRVFDKTPATTQPFDDVRPQIEDLLKRQSADQQIAARAAEFATRIETPADLDTIAAESGLTAVDTEFFGRTDPVPSLGVAPQVSAEAFQLEDGEVSAAITSPRGPVFVTVTGTREPYIPMLDDVKDGVRDDLIRTRATALSRERATAIAATLRSAPDFAAAAAAQGFEAAETELIARGSPLPDIGVSPEVDAAVFSLAVGDVSEPVTIDNATVIARVVERDDVTPDELILGKDAFRMQLLGERRNRFFAAYIAKAKERMRIELNQDVIARVLAAPDATGGGVWSPEHGHYH